MKTSKLFYILISIFFFINNIYAKEKIIAKIPEASGIAYSKKSDTLFVVNDEGTVYEISTSGEILREKKIGSYDFEGIEVDDEKGILLIALEGDDDILILSKKSMKKKKIISIKRSYKNIKVLKKGGNGIEGLTFYKNKIYLSNQSKKRYPKEDASVIVVLDYDLKKKKLKIKDIINHKYKDIAGLTFYKNNLFMVSDDESLLIEYNLKKKKVINEKKLPKEFAQEGITFDENGNLYIADDKGKILKIEEYER